MCERERMRNWRRCCGPVDVVERSAAAVEASRPSVHAFTQIDRLRSAGCANTTTEQVHLVQRNVCTLSACELSVAEQQSQGPANATADHRIGQRLQRVLHRSAGN